MSAPPLPVEPFVPPAVVAKLLNVSESWLRQRADALGLPVHRVGSQRRYRLSEVEAWVAAGGGNQ